MQKFWPTFRADLYRYSGKISLGIFLKHWFLTPGVKYSFYLRLCHALKKKPIKGLGLYYLFKFILIQTGFRYGIEIAESAQIGPGLYIGHFGGIVVNGQAVIGKNCNLSHGVTIGQQNRGERAGCPTLGDNVFIAPGAKIIGNVHIGNRVAIGANSVVVQNVPDDGVIGGIPAKLLSMDGSEGYINNIDY